jgi:hypothetical protein
MKEWGAVIAFLLAAIALAGKIYDWMSKDGDAAMAALKIHEKEAEARWYQARGEREAIDRRVQRLENVFEYMPSKDDFHNLTVAMAELKGVVSTLAVKVEDSGNKVDAMDDYLRKTGK